MSNLNIDPLTLWILGGILLIILEMLTGTFVLLFIGLGCLAAGCLASVQGFELRYGLQALLCAIVSMVGVFVLRKPIQTRLLKSVNLTVDIGREIQINQTIPPHQTARITYQGTEWFATNLDAHDLQQGDRVIIVGIDGNTLLLRRVH